MITIKDIANLAGVSVGTVSNVINGTKNVSSTKRQLVEQAIHQLNYVPNSIARTLKTKVSKTIGLIVPDISNPFYSELAKGVEDHLNEYGYALFVCNKYRTAEKERQYLDSLVEKNSDGIIVVKPMLEQEDLERYGKRCNLILIDTDLSPNDYFGVINVDDDASAYQLTELIYNMNHRKIAYFYGAQGARSDSQRFNGYKKCMEEHGIFSQDLVYDCGSYDIQGGYYMANEMFGQGNFPTAVFASNDMIAIGVIQSAFDHGLQIPQDISVVGCDDISISACLRPTLTTISRPKYQMGAVSAQLITDSLLKQKPFYFKEMLLTSNLMVRQSLRPPKIK